MRFMMLVRTTSEFSGPPPQALIDAINKQGEAAVKIRRDDRQWRPRPSNRQHHRAHRSQ